MLLGNATPAQRVERFPFLCRLAEAPGFACVDVGICLLCCHHSATIRPVTVPQLVARLHPIAALRALGLNCALLWAKPGSDLWWNV
jgi:hypothetical protein